MLEENAVSLGFECADLSMAIYVLSLGVKILPQSLYCLCVTCSFLLICVSNIQHTVKKNENDDSRQITYHIVFPNICCHILRRNTLK